MNRTALTAIRATRVAALVVVLGLIILGAAPAAAHGGGCAAHG